MATAASKSTPTGRAFVIEISPNRLRAHLEIRSPFPALPTRSELVEAARQAGVVVPDDFWGRFDQLTAEVAKGAPCPRTIELAVGRAPQDGRDEEFEWDPSFHRTHPSPDSDEPIDYYAFNSIVTVSKDAVIGHIRPAVEPVEGLDVTGKPVPAGRRPEKLNLDATIRRDADDPLTLRANVMGRVLLARRKLSIVEVLDIGGDVDFSTGHVDSGIDVNIRGTVHDRFRVRSGKCIAIGGAIEAAQVIAEGDIVVRGGLLGHGQGLVRANGSVSAKFGDTARVFAKQDIHISRELMGCRVHCESRVIVERGAILGGAIYARKGIEVGVLGSEASVPTRIAIGGDPRSIAEAERLEREVANQLAAVDKIRKTVMPLLQNVRRLSAAQKEQATEMLFKADEAEAAIRAKEQLRHQLLQGEGEGEPPRLIVHKAVYPGVFLSIGRRAAIINKLLKGPIVIEQRKVENVTEIVAVNKLTASIQILPSATIPTQELLAAFEPADALVEPKADVPSPADGEAPRQA